MGYMSIIEVRIFLPERASGRSSSRWLRRQNRIHQPIPGKAPPKGLRAIKLQGFPPLLIGALYQGTLKPIAKGFLDKVKKRAKTLAKRS